MNCEKAKKVIETWEERGKIDLKEYKYLASHVQRCSHCAHYRGLLPLIKHDIEKEKENISVSAKEPDWRKFEERVITNLPSRINKANAISLKKTLLPIAAMFILGISLFSIFYRVNTSSDRVTVRFVLTAPEANSVSLVGDFNNWQPTKLVLKDRKEGKWELTIKLKKGKVYTYNFLINGKQWIIDPNSYAVVDDGFGGKSSLLKL